MSLPVRRATLLGTVVVLVAAALIVLRQSGSDVVTTTVAAPNVLNPTTLTVHKDFVPDNASGSVTVSVACTLGGTPSPVSGSVTEAVPRT